MVKWLGKKFLHPGYSGSFFPALFTEVQGLSQSGKRTIKLHK